ncbi:MAG: cytochrome C [Candidatus Nitrotoga sp.]|nr:cytochrome C [Candidatus Nitrotoga sp.]
MKTHLNIAAILLAYTSLTWAGSADDIRHGRYLIQISGCNDCHTAGYMQNDGKVAEADWLTGDAMGWQGPWGTTYAANLRLLVQSMDEKTWVARARLPMRPPMPSPSLRAMSDADLKAIHRYIKSLGAKGQPMPHYVPPGGVVSTPYLDLTPKNLPQQVAK